MKRERAIAYSLSQQVCIRKSEKLTYYLFEIDYMMKSFWLQQWRSDVNSNTTPSAFLTSFKHRELDKNSWGWSWLERWMAAKPWENRLMEQTHVDPSETTPSSKNCDFVGTRSKSLGPRSVKVRKNNVTTRISAKPPLIGHATRSSSGPSSECLYDESSASSSSICTSTTPVSANTLLASERTEGSNLCRPSYMNLTESIKAKQRTCNNFSHRLQGKSMDDIQFHKKSGVFSNGDTKSSAGSDTPSINLSKPIYLPTRLDKNSMRVREKENSNYD